MSVWIFYKLYRSKKPGGFQRHLAVLLTALTMMGSAGVARAFGGYAIPTRPSAETLSGRLKPDLAIDDLHVSWQKGRTPQHAIRGRVTARIRNIGQAFSKPVPLVGSITAGGKVIDHRTFKIQALKPGQATAMRWDVRLLAGSNTIQLVLKDPHNRSNNMAQKTVHCAPPIELSHRGSPPSGAAGHRRQPPKSAKIPGRLKLRPDLAVTRIIFNDFRARKPEESWVHVEIRNVGTAKSRATTVLGVLRRADGSQERNVLPVKALGPGKTAVIEGPIRLSTGENTLTMQVRDQYNPGNNTLSRAHFFAPRRRGAIGAAQGRPGFSHSSLAVAPELAARRPPGWVGRSVKKKPAGVLPGRVVHHGFAKVMKPGAPVSGNAVKRPVPHDQQGTVFIRPRADEVVAQGRPYTISWSLPDDNPYSEFWLQLKADDPGALPVLFLARRLDPSTRSIPWDVSPELPVGTYQLELLSHWGSDPSLRWIAKTTFRIDHVRFHIVEQSVTPQPPALAKVGKNVTVSARLTNTGADAKDFRAAVKIYGPRDFQISRNFPVRSLGHNDSGVPLSVSFVPPFYGIYRAVFEPDAGHRYLHSSDDISEADKSRHINVNPLPDLLLTINKVTDGVLSVDTKHFHIHVKNVGQRTSPEAKVTFYLTGTGHHHYSIHPLAPGEEWEHEYTKKWYGSTGEKNYWAAVDPDHVIEEIDETNNRVSDHLHIYRAGQPMPEQHFTPPKLEVTSVYGLQPAMTAGEKYSLTVRFKNISPDRQDTPAPVLGDLDHDESHRISYTLVSFGADNAWVDIPSGYESSGGFTFSSNGVVVPELLPGEIWDVEIPIKWNKTRPMGVEPAATTYPSEFCIATHYFRWHYNHLSSPRWQFLPSSEKTIYCRKVAIQRPNPFIRAAANALAAKTPRRMGGGKSLRFLKPTGRIFWTAGKQEQIAWVGDVQPPYDVSLIPVGHPGAPVSLSTGLNVSALDYTVADDIAPGRYRVKVQGKNGWNASHDFEIHAGKPDLRIKAASISNRLSGDLDKPYKITVKTVIENRGGYENKPVKVRFSISKAANARQAFRRVYAEINAPPMVDRNIQPMEQTFSVPYADGYDIRVIVDQENQVEESDETNNEFRKRLYRVKGFSDLRLTCRQQGGRMFFKVHNRGDAISGGSNISFTYTHDDGNGTTRTHTVCSPHVLSLNPGDTTEVSCDIPEAAREGDRFSATVNKYRSFREITYANNTVRGTLRSAESTAKGTPGWFHDAVDDYFRVKDKTPRQQNFAIANGRQQALVHPRFRFVISHAGIVHEETPPVTAILVVRSGSAVTTHTFDVPTLYPAPHTEHDRHAVRGPSNFVINWPGSFPVGVNVSYTFSLRLGSNTLQVASGAVQIGYHQADSGH